MLRTAIPGLLTLSILTAACTPISFAQSDRDEVLAVVQKFFDAMAAADAAATRSVMMMDGQYYALRERGEEFVARRTTNEEYLAGLTDRTDSFLERMWDPVVSVTGRIAVVTARYDFHRNRDFSHCGTDVFNLIRSDEGWKIAGIMYTIELSGCEESPLGAPEF